MPRIDVIDSTWIPARPAVVAAQLADPRCWAQWWPGLALRMHEDRGEKGVRWLVTAVDHGPAAGLGGSAEVWLQPMFDGVIAHFFLRLDPVGGAKVGRRRAARVEREYRRRSKRAFWELADRADPDRMCRPALPDARAQPPQQAPLADRVVRRKPGSV